jgi:hypothetical protein
VSDHDIWREDARTDRAVELTMFGRAKTDADGEVVARHRYSRKSEYILPELLDLSWDSQSETVTITSARHHGEKPHATVTVTVEVVEKDGTIWEQEGTVSSDEDAYSWHALAACRALLNYSRDDGEPMTPDETIAMLEERRRQWRAALQVKRA